MWNIDGILLKQQNSKQICAVPAFFKKEKKSLSSSHIFYDSNILLLWACWRCSCSQVFDRLNSAEMLCLMREIQDPRLSAAECITAGSGSSEGPDSRHTAWLGGGSSSRRRGFVTAVNLDNSTVMTQVLTRPQSAPGARPDWFHNPFLLLHLSPQTQTQKLPEMLTQPVPTENDLWPFLGGSQKWHDSCRNRQQNEWDQNLLWAPNPVSNKRIKTCFWDPKEV